MAEEVVEKKKRRTQAEIAAEKKAEEERIVAEAKRKEKNAKARDRRADKAGPVRELTLGESIAGLNEEEMLKLARQLVDAGGDILKGVMEEASVEAARREDATGMEAFYRVIFGKEAPEHVVVWYKEIMAARAEGMGIALQAFRGSTKTTAVTIGYVAWQIGLHPERTNSIVMVSDAKAELSGKAIAGIIEFSEGWKRIFPQVVPDKDRGWSTMGWSVKNTGMEYGEWRKLTADVKDPTLFAAGWSSSLIIGSHPNGCLIIDDILDENNTSSAREMESVRQIIKSTINPTAMKGCFRGLVFTPWRDNDPVIEQANCGIYRGVKTPVLAKDDSGKWEWKGDKVRLAWSDMFGIDELKIKHAESGEIEFGRMYELDIERRTSGVFRYYSYPHEQINPSLWETGGGCDYASTQNKEGRSDFFVHLYGAVTPDNRLVVYDGVVARVTQMEAEAHLNKAQAVFPRWTGTVVEGDGKGEEFISVIMRNPLLKVIPMKTGGKGKEARLRVQMSPWLENMSVMVSDADTPALNALRYALDHWPNVEYDDALDGLYWLCRKFQKCLIVRMDEQALVAIGNRQKVENPYNAFGRAIRGE